MSLTNSNPADHPGPAHPRYDEAGRLVLRRHADVSAVALDPATFSNAVSRHLQLPNGLDGTVHAAWRERLDQFFTAEAMASLETTLTPVVAAVVADVTDAGPFDAVVELGSLVAVRCMTRWLGWSSIGEDELLDWVAHNRACSRSNDGQALAANARWFDELIHREIAAHRSDVTLPSGRASDPTDELLDLTTPEGMAITDAEIVSVLRNWTGGDLSSLALCVGVVVEWLVSHPDHHAHLRDCSDGALDAVIDEVLRLDDPFVSNRRLATHAATIAGCPIQPGDQLVLHWRDANRDPEAFPHPDQFDPHANADANLVYGIGPHVCPGRGLATLQLRLVVRALLAAGEMTRGPRPAVREEPPVAGLRSIEVILASRPVTQVPRQ